MQLIIKEAVYEDLKDIYRLVVELARFEHGEHLVTTTLQDYQRDFKEGYFEALIAQLNDQTVGMALYYKTYSTWRGKMLHLEDFIVDERFRNEGIGQKIFKAVINKAKSINCKLLRWEVLDWNVHAIRFYERHGATIEKNWWNGKIVF